MSFPHFIQAGFIFILILVSSFKLQYFTLMSAKFELVIHLCCQFSELSGRKRQSFWSLKVL